MTLMIGVGGAGGAAATRRSRRGRARNYRIWCDPTFGAYLRGSLGHGRAMNAAVDLRGFRNESASGKEIFRRAQDPLRARAVRGHPRRGQGQGRAGRTSGDGAHRRRGIRRLCAVGLRHGPGWAGLHGGRRSLDAARHSLDAGLRAHRLQWHGQGQAVSLLLARGAASASSRGSPRRGLTMYTGIEPEFMLLARRRGRQARALSTPPTTSTSPATTTRACRAPARCSTKSSPRLRAVGIDVYQIDHEDAQRPVRSQLHLCRCAEVRRQLHLRQDGGERDRAQARHDRHLHAEAVLQPHRQRRAFPHLAGQRRSRRILFDDKNDKSRPGALDAGLSFPRRRARSMRARWRPCARRP